jgi:hypothetical protein
MNAQVEDHPAVDEHARSKRLSLLRHRMRQLREPWESVEPWYRFDAAIERWESAPRGWYATTLPSLLEQLRMTSQRSGGSPAQGYKSKPPAQLDALDGERLITAQVDAFLVKYWGRHAATVEEGLVFIGGHAQDLSDDELHELEGRVRSWWVSAKVLSGVEARPLQPHARCPLCDKVDSLHVRLDVASRTGLAWCKECHETWDEETIGLLARSIEEQRVHREANTPGRRAVLAIFHVASVESELLGEVSLDTDPA